MPLAIEIIIGIIIETTAVLDVTSVNSSIIIIITNTKTKVDGVPNIETVDDAIKLANPVLNIPSDKAIPPPNNSNVPQSTNLESDQFNTNFWFFQSTGKRNNSKAPNNAIIFSSNQESFKENVFEKIKFQNGLVTQRVTTTKNAITVSFSPLVQLPSDFRCCDTNSFPPCILLISGGKTFNKTNHAIGTNKITTGTPIFIQSIKLNCFIPEAPKIETHKPFGGVPIIVPTPPIEAAHAIPSIIVRPKFDLPISPSP